MRFLQHVLVFFVLLLIAGTTGAQQLRENEIVVIQGNKFILHQVRTGETIYAISKKYNTDGSTLLKHNPEVADGLKIGQILKIPYSDGVELQNLPPSAKGDPSGFIHHTIESRTETPYFIAKEYGITVEEVYAYNPEIRRFKRGTVVRIPQWNDIPATGKTAEQAQGTKKESAKVSARDEDDELISHKVQRGETLYSIAKKYNLTESEVLFFNPGARQLKAGDVLYLPGSKDQEQDVIAESEEKAPATEKYFNHTIASGETLWGLSQKYNVPVDKLKEVNPVLQVGVPAGVVIKIPVNEDDDIKAKPVNEDAFTSHRVKRGETLYSISSDYHLKIAELKKYNPALNQRNPVTGEVLLIPKRTDQQIADFMNRKDSALIQQEPGYYEVETPLVIPEACQPGTSRLFAADLYDIALFLPLFIQANDTLNKRPRELMLLADSIAMETESEVDTLLAEEELEDMFFGFYGNSANYLQFYEGVLLAVDSMQRAGMRIMLHVYDTHQNPDSARKHIYKKDFLQTDLIIGPVFPEVQHDIAQIAAKNRIPIISPLSSNAAEVQGNPYYYQVNPTREYIASQTADLIAEEYFDSNFIIFKMSDYAGTPDGKIVNQVQEKLFNSGFWGKPNGVSFTIYDFHKEGPFGFRRILSKSKENVIYIPSSDVGELSVAISNINNLADDYPVTLIGTSRFQQYESIDIEHFHNLKLEYIAPYWINYQNPNTVKFLEKFKKNFYTEPNSFGVQGYDVAFFFLNALYSYGREFNECLPYLQAELIQGNYQFEKVAPFGGYMNQGVSVISYTKKYDVVQERVIGKYRVAQK